MDVLLAGLFAGYGIAVPVGAIAVLIVQTGVRCGFPCAAAAGAGAATADFLYSVIAVAGGSAIAGAITGIEEPLRYGSAAVLAVIAVSGLRRLASPPEPDPASVPRRRELAAAYAKFLGLTVVNPTTVIYFAAFIIGLGIAENLSAAQGAVFATAAFAASLSWQLLLAALGAFAGRKLPRRFHTTAGLVGSVAVLGMAIAIVMR